MNVAFLGLGSNLGDRRQQLADALRALAAAPGISLVTGSSIYESKPVGVIDQPDFLNLVVQVETTHSPLELLAVCLQIEASLGRERRERWGPRTIDLDLLVYGDVAVSVPSLTLPHPRMHERSFVMIPLAEIAPHVKVNKIESRDVARKLSDDGLRAIESWTSFLRWAKLRADSAGRP